MQTPFFFGTTSIASPGSTNEEKVICWELKRIEAA